MTDIDRRTFLMGAGAAAIAPLLAGCSGDGGNGGDGGGDVPQEIDEHLSDANGYDGSLADHTGEGEVTVDVGAGDVGYAFSPAAVRIDSGTTVVWEWTGEGGTHNVVHQGGDFESDLYSDQGETFEHTFEESGNYRYYCNPHRDNGMKGGGVVE
jgi:serine/threonine-protein kinase